MKPPIGKREYHVYMEIDTRLPGAERVKMNGPAYGVDARDALASAIDQVYGSFSIYCSIEGKQPRPLIFPVAATEVVPTLDELRALAEPTVTTVKARR